MNPLIRLREVALNTILGTREDEVLNDPPPPVAVDGVALAAELKQAVNRFKAMAMDEEGRQVAYQQLRDDPAYITYRTKLTPLLQRFDPASLPDRPTRLAFWINLYNALVIDAVITFGITTSIAEQWAGLSFFSSGSVSDRRSTLFTR